MNGLRSEITETTPIRVLKGKKSKYISENLIEFPTQPEDHNRHELLGKIKDNIKCELIIYENKREVRLNKNKKKVEYKVGQKVLTKNHHHIKCK